MCLIKALVLGDGGITTLGLTITNLALVPAFLCADELARKRLELVRHKVKPIPFALCTIVPRRRTLPKYAAALLEMFPTQ